MSKRKDIRKALKAEREECRRIARRVLTDFERMGFLRNADRVEGARAVLTALGEPPADTYVVQHVAGLTVVPDPY